MIGCRENSRCGAAWDTRAARHFVRGAVWSAVCSAAWILIATAGFAGRASAQQLTPAWVEMGESGAIVRVVVTSPGDCPHIDIDGATGTMAARIPVPKGFRPACQSAIPRGARSVKVNGRALTLPRANPRRIVAFGDTGCRIKKGDEVQNCNDMDKWPFAEVSTRAASEKPALVVHVGDYLYREMLCPKGSEDKCGDTPAGDNWETWNADFFTPAAKLLAAAPWAFSRGNHETCARAWRGWFYYLDPRPWTGKCEQYSPAYAVRLGAFELIMLDSSQVTEDKQDAKQVSIYAGELRSIHAENAWLVDHHPFWGFKEGATGAPPVPLTATLEAAWDSAVPKGIHLVLSGHIHLFEVMSFEGARPTQLVTGDGGTNLAGPIPASVNGAVVGGEPVLASQSRREFGYTLLTKMPAKSKSWRLELKDRLQHVMLECSILDGPAKCTRPGTDQSSLSESTR